MTVLFLTLYCACVLQGTLQQFVDNFFHSVLNSNQVVPPAVKYFFDFLDEQAEKYDIKDEDTVHIWKTNRFVYYLRPVWLQSVELNRGIDLNHLTEQICWSIENEPYILKWCRLMLRSFFGLGTLWNMCTPSLRSLHLRRHNMLYHHIRPM